MFLYSLLALAVVTALIFAAPLKAKVWATLAVVAAGALWASATAVGVLAGGHTVRLWATDVFLFGSDAGSMDPLSALFALIVSVGAVAAVLYSRGYLAHYLGRKSPAHISLHYTALATMFYAMLGVVTSEGGFSFLIFWELMTVASFLLILFDAERREVRRAAGFFIHHPADAADYLLSPTLAAVSRTAWLLILVVGLLAWLRSRALRTRKVTDGATWGCGFTSPNVRMQYSGESYSEGLQSIATSLTQNSGEGGAVGKGEIFPAAHNFDIRHKDRFDQLFAAWWVELLRVINKRAMRLRTGKINHYVLFALAFLVLIFLLSIFNLI